MEVELELRQENDTFIYSPCSLNKTIAPIKERRNKRKQNRIMKIDYSDIRNKI
jgi:hypothetical protein